MMAVLFAVVAGIVLLSVGTVAFLTVERVNDQAEQQALGIARTLAADSSLRQEVARLDGQRTPDAGALAAGPIQHDAEAARARTGALFVVVTNDLGIRLSHPNPDELGRPVSTDPVALNGHEFVAREHGTLGESVRAKVPVFGESGTVIGEVSTGVAVETVSRQVRQAVLSVLLVGVAALVLAGFAAATLVRWLRKVTLGLEPEEMAQLVRDQEAVLYGVDDGVIGIGPDGRISLRNRSARLMLELPRRSDSGDIVGLPYAEAALPDKLVRAVAAVREDRAEAGAPVRLELPERVVRAVVHEVSREGTSLGQVVMLRDLTTLEELGSRLNAVETMAGALRAQRHEFANRLHTISGLLAHGEVERAGDYVGQIIDSGPVREPVANIAAVTDPYLRAFIGAKGIQAHERGVALRVGEATALFGTLAEAQDVTAILGNLIDNALEAAVTAPTADADWGPEPAAGAGSVAGSAADPEPGAGLPRWVEVDLLSEGTTLHLAVADSGGGLVPGMDVFAEGATTRPGDEADAHGHGVGLGLARRLARLIGGDLWIADAGGAEPGAGAVFAARLPGVLDEPLPASGHRPAKGTP